MALALSQLNVHFKHPNQCEVSVISNLIDFYAETGSRFSIALEKILTGFLSIGAAFTYSLDLRNAFGWVFMNMLFEGHDDRTVRE